MPLKTPGNVFRHTTDVVRGIHVGRIEARDHRDQIFCAPPGSGIVSHRDHRVGERVVVEGSVGIEVVFGRSLSIDIKGPLLLQRNSKQARRGPPDPP